MIKKTNIIQIVVIVLLLSTSNAIAQSLLFPSDYLYDQQHMQIVLADSSKTYPVHNAIQPFISSAVDKADSIRCSKPEKNIIIRKLLYESLININYIDKQSEKSVRFVLKIDPILSYQQGMSFEKSDSVPFYLNTRGIRLRTSIGSKFRMESAFFENQAFFPNYISKYSSGSLVVPGQGRWKNFKKTGFDYAMACAIMSYDFTKNINVTLGHGKLKSGYGYRSLLLSDNAFNFPYARLNTKFLKGKIQYSITYASLMNLNNGGTTTPPGTERLFQKKAASFQELSFALHKNISFSFFQSFLWNSSNNRNNNKINFEYFNPIIFSHAAIYGMDSARNVMLGVNLEVKLLRSLSLYGQLMLDDASTNKSGIQAGLKYFNAFGVKNLFLQGEFNSVSPFAYAQRSSSQSYTHYAQALAHPSGSNFNEVVSMLRYSIKRFSVLAKVNYIQQTLLYGENIFAPFISTSAGSTLPAVSFTTIGDFRLDYLINPSWNMYVTVGHLYRLQENSVFGFAPSYNNTSTLYFGLRTSLSNFYWDF